MIADVCVYLVQMLSVDSDLQRLWDDAKHTNDIDSKRLMMGLTKAGLV